jgi:hypothetical protein
LARRNVEEKRSSEFGLRVGLIVDVVYWKGFCLGKEDGGMVTRNFQKGEKVKRKDTKA